MRPASCRLALWMSVCFLLASFFVAQSLAYGQTTSPSKRKLSRQVPPQQSAVDNVAPTPNGVRPLVTTETWTGGTAPLRTTAASICRRLPTAARGYFISAATVP
jgi:hypothetical protein